MSKALKFNRFDPEKVEISYAGTHIITANHDDDGWNGMERIVDSLTKLANKAGIPIVEVCEDTEEF